MALFSQPDEVQTGAAEGNKNPTSKFQIKTRPEPDKQGVHRLLIKINSFVAPALQPEHIVTVRHDNSNLKFNANILGLNLN
jgi:hypothetical protein